MYNVLPVEKVNFFRDSMSRHADGPTSVTFSLFLLGQINFVLIFTMNQLPSKNSVITCTLTCRVVFVLMPAITIYSVTFRPAASGKVRLSQSDSGHLVNRK